MHTAAFCPKAAPSGADFTKSNFQNGTLMVPCGTDMVPVQICVNLMARAQQTPAARSCIWTLSEQLITLPWTKRGFARCHDGSRSFRTMDVANPLLGWSWMMTMKGGQTFSGTTTYVRTQLRESALQPYLKSYKESFTRVLERHSRRPKLAQTKPL